MDAKRHLQEPLDENKLHLKEFWTEHEPCHWNLIRYMEELLKANPAVNRREASRWMISDAKTVKENVVSGTVAETMLNAMIDYAKNARAKQVFQAFFIDNAEAISRSTLKYNSQKSRLRGTMAQQVADEEESDGRRKRQMDERNDNGEGSSSSARKKQNVTSFIEANGEEEQRMTYEDDTGEGSSSGGNQTSTVGKIRSSSGAKRHDCIWQAWRDFLNEPENTQHLMELSPEKHKVIWCGKLVRRRSCLPPYLYSKLNKTIPSIERQYIAPCFADEVMVAVDAECLERMATAINGLCSVDPNDINLLPQKKALVDILNTFCDDIYDGGGENIIKMSEGCYRSYLFDACIKHCVKSLRLSRHNLAFFPGELELEAVTTQMKQEGVKDGRYKYNADGIIKAGDFSGIEILLTEVSSAYGSSGSRKSSLDHYKAMFGMLAMMKRAAQIYPMASFATFRKLKLHFLHGHGDAIRHWSMSAQAPGTFFMHKEQRVAVPAEFKSKDVLMPSFLQFYLTMMGALEDTIQVLTELKEEHKTTIRASVLRQQAPNEGSLLKHVNPILVKLSEGKHMSIVADEGPASVPVSPSHE